MDFRAIKSNDIVIHQGQRHIVKNVELVDGDVRLHIQPIENKTVSVSYRDVTSPSNNDSPQRLVAANIAQKSMQIGWRYSKITRSKTDALPYSNDEVVRRIKSLLINEIKSSDRKFINQSMLDRVVSKIATAQGYMIAQNGQNAVKSNRDVATWQHIANVAVRLSNAYNKKLLDVRRI